MMANSHHQQQQQHHQMHQSSFEVWNNFFHSAGIPSSVSHDYAMKFSQHRIRIDMLQEISKEILLDMGIKAMGDIIAILRHAKSICTQNELKPISGVVKSFGPPNHIITPATFNSNPSTLKNTSRATPVTSNKATLDLVPASSGGTVGNKIQSRLSLRSGAVMASSSYNGLLEGKRTNSSISSSLAKRLAPAPSEKKLNLDLTEKTLTVKYPSRAAIAKAAQRISGSSHDSHANSNHNHQRTTSASNSIKSRLGSVGSSNGGGKYESNSGNNIRLQSNTHISKHNNRSSSSSKVSSRETNHRAGQSKDRTIKNGSSSSDRQVNNRLKSTVFSRLGQSVR